jgi:tellurite resistance protein
LAIHLPPAALLSLSAALIDQPELATFLLGLAALIFVLLLASARWLVVAGFTALWGAFTFPLAAFPLALMAYGGPATVPGLILTTAALAITPTLAWKILKLWPGGKLAARTNAATA